MATTPDQILAAALNPLQDTVNRYGQGQVDLARLQLVNGMQRDAEQQRLAQEQQNATALLSQRLAGEKDLQLAVEKERQTREDIRQQGLDRRADARLQNYIDRLDDQQLGQRALQLQQHGVQQQPGESLKDFVARGTTEVVRHHASALDSYDSQLDAIAKARNAATQAESIRQANLASTMAMNQAMNSLDLNLSPAEKAAINSRMANGLRFTQALSDPTLPSQIKQGRIDALRTAYSQQLNTLLPDLQATRNPDYQQTISDLDRRENSVSARRNALLNSPFGPAAESYRASRGGEPTAVLSGSTPATAPTAGQPMPPDQILKTAASKSTKPGQNSDVATQILSGTASPTTLAQKPNPMESTPNRFLPAALQDPDVATLAANYHPLGKNLAQDPGDIISNTLSGVQSRIEAGQAALDKLGVNVLPDGRVVVPESEEVNYGTGAWAPSQRVALSPAERQRRLDAATQIISGMASANADGRKLAMAAAAANKRAPRAVVTPTPAAPSDSGSVLPAVGRFFRYIGGQNVADAPSMPSPYNPGPDTDTATQIIFGGEPAILSNPSAYRQ